MKVAGEKMIHPNPEWVSDGNGSKVSSLFALGHSHIFLMTIRPVYRLYIFPIFSLRNDSQMLYDFTLHKLLSISPEEKSA